MKNHQRVSYWSKIYLGSAYRSKNNCVVYNINAFPLQISSCDAHFRNSIRNTSPSHGSALEMPSASQLAINDKLAAIVALTSDDYETAFRLLGNTGIATAT